ncbi:hypothetical protein IR083_19805 [Dysgonomonas sp. GY75]|uniref:hypothetical protein n=1 Tax=Dysgonomonas sp. GY75 TaxID=2780419 RepID=UPI001883DC3D|nr:hypothetical protein [Dysgonomonas sp. GY75]MBF0651065.1 hypothetical protein [Dysgonomonas sp. GY75]
MLQITTTDKQVFLQVDNYRKIPCYKGQLRFRLSDAGDRFYVHLWPSETPFINVPMNKGVTIDGQELTPENIDGLLEGIGAEQGGGGVTDHGELTGREDAGQHPFTAISGTLADNAGSTALPATVSGTLASKIQALRNNVKALFSYFSNGKANSAAQADKLAQKHTFTLTGDLTGSDDFDGTRDVNMQVTLNSLGLVKNGVVRISGNGGDYASAVGEYNARRYFKLVGIEYQTQGWDSKLVFDIYYTQAAPEGHAGLGEVSGKVMLRLKFDPDDTFDIIQRPEGVAGNGIIMLHDAVRRAFEVYACASPGTVDSNRLYIDVRNMFYYVVNNDDYNFPVVGFFANQGSYSNNTGLTQREFNALPKTSMKWLWDNLFTELLPSETTSGTRITGFLFTGEPDPSIIVPNGMQVNAFNMSGGALRLSIVSQDWLEGNGNQQIGAIGFVDYGGEFTPVWRFDTGWQPSFNFMYADNDREYYINWDNATKYVTLTPYDTVTAVDANNALLDGFMLVFPE